MPPASGFPWSECQVTKTGDKSLYNEMICKTCGRCVCGIRTHTGKCTVTACRTLLEKVRKGGDFFYGIEEHYENHSEGV